MINLDSDKNRILRLQILTFKLSHAQRIGDGPHMFGIPGKFTQFLIRGRVWSCSVVFGLEMRAIQISFQNSRGSCNCLYCYKATPNQKYVFIIMSDCYSKTVLVFAFFLHLKIIRVIIFFKSFLEKFVLRLVLKCLSVLKQQKNSRNLHRIGRYRIEKVYVRFVVNNMIGKGKPSQKKTCQTLDIVRTRGRRIKAQGICPKSYSDSQKHV